MALPSRVIYALEKERKMRVRRSIVRSAIEETLDKAGPAAVVTVPTDLLIDLLKVL